MINGNVSMFKRRSLLIDLEKKERLESIGVYLQTYSNSMELNANLLLKISTM